MQHQKKKLLFILHNTTRTGAPLSVLTFLKWLNAKSNDFTIHIISLDEEAGLFSEFKKESQDIRSAFIAMHSFKGLVIRLARRFSLLFITDFLVKQKLKSGIISKDYDLIFANTILSITAAIEIKKYLSKPCPILLYLHELDYIIQRLLPTFYSLTDHVSHFFCASSLVAENLKKNSSIDDNIITIVFESTKILTSDIHKKCNDIITIGGAGMYQWRKGPDLFIAIAKYVTKHYINKPVKFVWAGAISDNDIIDVHHDLKLSGLSNIVSFIGEQSDIGEIYNSFDIFLMTSREDPFPLVCIEVGQLGKPIILFRHATGTESVIENGGGTIVNYLDIEEAGKAVLNYLNNPELRLRHGEEAKHLFRDFTPDKNGNLILDQFIEMISNPKNLSDA